MQNSHFAYVFLKCFLSLAAMASICEDTLASNLPHYDARSPISIRAANFYAAQMASQEKREAQEPQFQTGRSENNKYYFRYRRFEDFDIWEDSDHSDYVKRYYSRNLSKPAPPQPKIHRQDFVEAKISEDRLYAVLRGKNYEIISLNDLSSVTIKPGSHESPNSMNFIKDGHVLEIKFFNTSCCIPVPTRKIYDCKTGKRLDSRIYR